MNMTLVESPPIWPYILGLAVVIAVGVFLWRRRGPGGPPA